MKENHGTHLVIQQDEITYDSLKGQNSIAVDYADGDIVIVDNIKNLAEPSATRLQMNMVAICIDGRVSTELNSVPTLLQRNQVLICPPHTAFSNFMFSADLEFKAIFLTDRILQSFLRERISIWNEVMYVHKLHVVTMDAVAVEFFARFYDILRFCIDAGSETTPYRSEVIQSILRGAFLGLCGTLREQVEPQPRDASPQGGTANIFQRFLDLLGHTAQKHRPVDYYASVLCISPKYLSVVCKKNSGKSANQWIAEYVMEDIRYCLRQTDLSIKQVCNQLGFPNPSFFGRYVKEHFGMTPTQLRHQ